MKFQPSGIDRKSIKDLHELRCKIIQIEARRQLCLREKIPHQSKYFSASIFQNGVVVIPLSLCSQRRKGFRVDDSFDANK